VKNTGHRYCS